MRMFDPINEFDEYDWFALNLDDDPCQSCDCGDRCAADDDPFMCDMEEY
jgi:hypothetical protein